VGAGPKASRTWSSFLWTRGTVINDDLDNFKKKKNVENCADLLRQKLTGQKVTKATGYRSIGVKSF
jgi:hypothetical protein